MRYLKASEPRWLKTAARPWTAPEAADQILKPSLRVTESRAAAGQKLRYRSRWAGKMFFFFFTPVGCSGDPPQCADTLPVRVDFPSSKGSKTAIWDIDSQCRLYYLQNGSIIWESVDKIQTRIPAPCSNYWILANVLRNKILRKKVGFYLIKYEYFNKKVRFWMQIGSLCRLISQDSKVKFWIFWN